MPAEVQQLFTIWRRKVALNFLTKFSVR